tara:strand:+ start:286 stop:1365 length:1080 start_codon:yes stop_codon:yes gene_type:complete
MAGVDPDATRPRRTASPRLSDASARSGAQLASGNPAPHPVSDTGTGEAGDIAHFLRNSSLNDALDVVGDWWTQRILRESFLGVRQFEAMQTRLHIPRQTLSQRLKHLVTHGLLDVSRGGYRLTERGLALYPWALMVWEWTRKWGGEAGPTHPASLTHYPCGQVMTPLFVCGACLVPVGLRDVSYRGTDVPPRAPASPTTARTRWKGSKVVMDADRASHHIAFITADRWTHLILGAIFFGCRSFDHIAREIGIASNILSHRLKLLLQADFLQKKRSAEDARRFVYALTPRSRDVFPLTISLLQWADTQLKPGVQPPVQRFHRGCGARLQTKVICSHCHGELLPRAVGFQHADPSAPLPTT